MYYSSIRKITLASILFSSTTHAMEQIKPIALGLGAVASLGLAYIFTPRSKSTVTIVPEHTPGKDGKPDHYLLFSLYKTSNNVLIGSIIATYDPLTHEAILEFIQVFKEHQKHGYGVRLWNTMIDELKKQNIRVLMWKALPESIFPSDTEEYQKELETLIAWYEKRGGKVVKRNSGEAYMILKIQA